MPVSAPAREPAQARGAERRQALLDAAVRLLAREGARAVTHRAVAQEAGASHGAPRYYFATRDQLVDAALGQIAEREVAAAERALRGSRKRSGAAAELARFVAGTIERNRDASAARYELFLEAARRPGLRPALAAWGEAYERLLATELTAGAADPRADARLLLNTINGLLLAQLADPDPDFERQVLRPAIERFSGS